MRSYTVLDLLDLDLKEHNALDLRCIGGRPGLARTISEQEINRPGLSLSGYFEEFANNRIQLFGMGEASYLTKLEAENQMETVNKMFTYPIPCVIFTHGNQPGKRFMECAEKSGCPVLQTHLPSGEFSMRLMRALNDMFAPRKSIHGVLVEVYGIGVLLSGDSGVGKSETALELIERGHRLISDDMVEIRCMNGNILMGAGRNPVLAHHMEIRGLGIINVSNLFGVGAIRDKKQIQLIVELEEWDSSKNYDRIGTGEMSREILGVKVPLLQVPVKPGRNIPIIIETAAMNERLKKMGYHSAQEFNQNVLKWLESENARNLYFNKKDTF
ncbi:HPr(Ser) kinase/phosphatase [Sediminispirochaeta bajacaliforniensis]|uniref:HPr(Ser) kinase/phosphatase n=1 Tax=Sediminispirochaeta bajacaliforniensis TaxID=148 RepID=UPI000370A0D1|nr:HPr(Ser) kinase/phosphatase [Sediminispirochaeta bajacaliforniensis]